MVQLARSAERLLASGAGPGRPTQDRLHHRAGPVAIPRYAVWALHCSTVPAGGTGPVGPTVATLRTVDGEAGCLPLSPAQVQEAQERAAPLVHVQSWLAAGKRPEWADVAALDTETRAYHSQWASLEAWDGVLYRRWRALGRGAHLLQLLVPRPPDSGPARLSVRLGEAGGEHRGSDERPHI
ncbi:hypothetical protein AAFF_G00040200 [Aldrovandia affinis]|uniref:Uncharacterized protein n=1 Tax=Aldrovandia affinis TaxID=143900 RepID=A0AAD7VXA7_9TELE|nr:hypothetical protein AAFF_G00040200 [Aldrovandia affinis]